MLYEDKELPELFYMKHLHDTNDVNVDYEKKILTKTLSNLMFSNDKMNNFLLMCQKLLSLYFDKFNVIKNWKNYTVDKYHYKHKN